MSIDATRATWKLKNVTSVQKLILLSLADRAGEDGECWPSIRRLMEDTNLSRHAIINNRKLLCEKGLIEFTGELKGRSKQIPVMRLTYIDNREGLAEKPEEYFTSVESSTGEKFTSVESNTSDQCRIRHTEPKRIEPKNNIYISEQSYPQVEGEIPTPSEIAKEKKLSDESFDIFYKNYPVKKAENMARNAWWSQRCFEYFDLIMESLFDQIENDTDFKTGYAPNPARYIFEERWKDKPVIRKQKKSVNNLGGESVNKNSDWDLNMHLDLF